MDSIFSDVVKLSKDNYESLLEGRYLLELAAAMLAAPMRSAFIESMLIVLIPDLIKIINERKICTKKNPNFSKPTL